MIPSILEQLNVTEEVFNTYISTLVLDPIEITYELYSFDTPYNGNVIDNIAWGDYYYVIRIDGKVYLQNIVPFVEWFIWITNENKQQVIDNHIGQLQDAYQTSQKFAIAVDYFSLQNQ